MPPSAKKKDKTAALDGLVVDLFKRVEHAVEYEKLSASDHLDGVAAIHRILAQIQKQEKDRTSRLLQGGGHTAAPLTTADERMGELTAWLQQQKGVEMEGLELRSNLPEGCGVVATRAFSEGELLSCVPQDCMMTVLTGIKSQADVGLIFAADPWFRAVPSLILAMHLLFEKHARTPEVPSRWHGYIRSLPGQTCLHESNSTGPDAILLPLAFSMDAISTFRGTTALVEYHRMLRTVAKQYCHMRTVLKQLSPLSPLIETAATSWFTFAEFRWAVSTVMFRQNPIPVVNPNDGSVVASVSNPVLPETTLALIPLLDMFNHEEGPMTAHFDVPSQASEVRAKRNFGAGDQVYISYGSRPNSMYLLYSGFVPSSNQRDRIRIMVELPASDPLYNKKLALLKWLELPPSALLDIFYDGRPSPELATWLRVVSTADEGAVTAELRSAIAARAKETARMLEAAKVAAGTADAATEGEDKSQGKPEGETGSAKEGGKATGSPPDSKPALSAAAALLLKELCSRRLQELQGDGDERRAGSDAASGANGHAGPPTTEQDSSSSNADAPQGLGLGLGGLGVVSKEKSKGGSPNAVAKEVVAREVELASRIRKCELVMLERALELVAVQPT